MALHHLTKNCNQNCVFCSDRGRQEPEKDFSARVRGIAADDDDLIRLSGGEPFLLGCRELTAYIALIRKKGKTPELQTNATLLTTLPREKLAVLVQSLNAARGYFNVNFSASNPAMDKRITGRSGLFTKRLAGVKLLKRLGATIRLTYVVNRENYRDVPGFCSFLKNEMSFVDWVQFSFVKGMGSARGNKAIVPEYRKASPFLVKGLDLLEKYGIKAEVDHIPPCFLGRHWRKHVDVYKMNGGVKGLHLKEKKKLKSCGGCRLYTVCSGPRKDYLNIYGGI